MRRRDMIAGGLAAILAGTAVREAQAAEYVLLGSRTVSLLRDHDRIYVGLFAGVFSRIRLEVTGNAIFIEALRVRFNNGDRATLPVRYLIPAGGRTRDILLPGLLRTIAYIDLQYRSVPLGGRAVVRVVGKRL